jgi:hypothetical protein
MDNDGCLYEYSVDNTGARNESTRHLVSCQFEPRFDHWYNSSVHLNLNESNGAMYNESFQRQWTPIYHRPHSQVHAADAMVMSFLQPAVVY